MPYTSKVSSPGISIDTNNDGVIDGRIHQIKNAGNFNTFSITNGVLTVQGPTGGAAIGGSDTHIQFNDGGVFGGESTLVYNKTSNTLSVSNLTVTDTLTVTTTTTLNSNTVTIGDNIIVLNSDATGSASASAGIEIERGDDANVSFLWNETSDYWDFDEENIAQVGTIHGAGSLVYTFTSDPDTGIEHVGANQLGLKVGGSRVLATNANGVHINPSGASGATNALDVVGTATVTGDLDVDDINVDGQTVSTSSSNKNLILTPHGSGAVELGGVSSNATTVTTTASAHNVVGTTTTLSAGSTTAGTTNNIAGGGLTLTGGQGKGTGAGGSILFKVAPPGSSGSSLNSLATAVTISGSDKSAVFEGAVTVNGNLTVSGTTTTVSSTTVSHADPVLQLNQGETNDAGAGVTGSVSGFQVDRGSNSGTDIAITRLVWDDSVDAFRCQIANNAPTNSTFVDTQLRVGTPSDANDAATKGYVDTEVAGVKTYSQSSVASSSNVNLRLTDSDGGTDDILLTAGSNIAFSSVSAAGFTIAATDTNTFRTVTAGGASGTDNTLGTSENLALAAGSNMTITESGGVVTFASSGGGTVDVVSNVATSTILGRVTGGSGDSEELTAAQVRTLINVENGADVTDATNVNAAGAIMHSDLGTKGDLAVGDGSGDVTILGVGTNNHVLTADSSEPSGVKWAAVSGGGSGASVAFKTIAVSGQSDVVADAADDTLTLAGAGGMTITTNATSDTITFTSSDTTDAAADTYTPANPGHWDPGVPPPPTVEEAINRLVAYLATHISPTVGGLLP